ncbi:hypothetical protein GCM10012279_31030 [Micromonospora yangpuensis]|nr:hypothetical protein GCM10012279_31030 [Micromonospora yangpuensis]
MPDEATTPSSGRQTPEDSGWYSYKEEKYGTLFEEGNFRQFAQEYLNLDARQRQNPRRDRALSDKVAEMRKVYLEGREFHYPEVVQAEWVQKGQQNLRDWDLTEQFQKMSLKGQAEQGQASFQSLGGALATSSASPGPQPGTSVAAGLTSPGASSSAAPRPQQNPSDPSAPASPTPHGGRPSKRAKKS